MTNFKIRAMELPKTFIVDCECINESLLVKEDNFFTVHNIFDKLNTLIEDTTKLKDEVEYWRDKYYKLDEDFISIGGMHLD